jgi:hypothetical protein
MNIINVGETLIDELHNIGLIIHPTQLNQLIDALRNHDATKRNVPPEVSRVKLRVELASRTVPTDCPAVQGGMAVAGANLLDTIDAIIAAGDRVTQEYWDALGMVRTVPLVAQFGLLFGYDDAALDELWISASTR